jgi:hypothetical protein
VGVNKQRIQERIASKPNWYKKGKVKVVSGNPVKRRVK